MAAAKSAVISLTIMALFGASVAATTYTVGDNAGWTTQGKVDYYSWVDGKEFKVGDTLGESLKLRKNEKFYLQNEKSKRNYLAGT
ncbi:hypothetical protein CISIN_1g047479mg [Citrus sinensis]|uniref:Phytocyanin domain-containing protein n=1 Tax=Citrus sinensis TaxID=2711 RepID=A0A067DF84_CITSI|nr:hypothetical protein CISIN_1g047479mg [Citrus sinensis]